jgi:hypothetical protein
LTLKRIKFVQPEAFQTFVSFIKSLNNVSELAIHIVDDQREKYSEIWAHLLSLPSLTKLTWDYPKKSKLKIKNPSVRNVTIFGFSMYNILDMFPNVDSLEFPLKMDYLDLLGFSSFKLLRELKLLEISPMALKFTSCPQVEKFSFNVANKSSYFEIDASRWSNFFQTNTNINCVEANPKENDAFNYPKPLFLEHLLLLPELKTLKFHFAIDIGEEIETVQFIGENLAGLQYLAIIVSETNLQEAFQLLQSTFSQLGSDAKKYKKSARGWNWLLTFRN